MKNYQKIIDDLNQKIGLTDILPILAVNEQQALFEQKYKKMLDDLIQWHQGWSQKGAGQDVIDQWFPSIYSDKVENMLNFVNYNIQNYLGGFHLNMPEIICTYNLTLEVDNLLAGDSLKMPVFIWSDNQEPFFLNKVAVKEKIKNYESQHQYKMFIDDERFPVSDDWVICRSSDEAMKYIENNALPVEIAFDHDLGGDDTAMLFCKQLQKYLIESGAKIPHNFKYSVHSQNPIGAENIKSYMNQMIKHFKCLSIDEILVD